MDFHQDFADLFELLNKNAVDFLVVGGYAVAFHGAPRFTGDIDIWICPDFGNVRKLLHAIAEFGFSTSGLGPEELVNQKRILQLGETPLQIHIMMAVSGCDWNDAWASRVPGTYSTVPVQFIGREELVRNKRAAGRTKDAADLEALGEKPG